MYKLDLVNYSILDRVRIDFRDTLASVVGMAQITLIPPQLHRVSVVDALTHSSSF